MNVGDVYVPLEARGPCEAVISDRPGDLQRIREPDVLVAIYQRTVDSELRQYVDEVLSSQLSPRNAIGNRPGATLEPLLAGLLDVPGAEAFRDDLRWQVGLFCQLAGCDRVRLKLESFAGSLCERFHTDRVRLRLICSYAGPGTEWLEDRHVDRTKLGPGSRGLPDEQSGLLRDGAHVRCMDRFAVALMKGSLWHGSNGLVHRSPRVVDPALRRVLFKIDVGDE